MAAVIFGSRSVVRESGVLDRATNPPTTRSVLHSLSLFRAGWATNPPWKAARHPTGTHEETSAGITVAAPAAARPVNCGPASPGSPGDRSRCASTDVEELNRSSTHVVLTPTTPPAATWLRTVTSAVHTPPTGERSPGQHGRRLEQDAPSISFVTSHRSQHPSRQIRLTSPFTGSGSRLRIPGACRCSADRCQGSAADVRITSVAGRPSDTPAFG